MLPGVYTSPTFTSRRATGETTHETVYHHLVTGVRPQRFLGEAHRRSVQVLLRGRRELLEPPAGRHLQRPPVPAVIGNHPAGVDVPRHELASLVGIGLGD